MPKTMCVTQEGPANALHLDCNRDFNQVIIAGRTVFKIYDIGENAFEERVNLRGCKNVNLNYSCNDVVWSALDENLVATAATNGAVVLWNLSKSSRSKQYHVFSQHKRTVNKVNFHPMDASLLISGSQDGHINVFDMRIQNVVCNFTSSSECVRDVQFNPHMYNQFASVSENGKLKLWDLRRPDKADKSWPAHSDHIFSCDWHPEVRSWIATGSRDKSVKVWDVSHPKKNLQHTIYTIGPVGKVKWRPQRHEHIGSSALVVDFAINVWDIRRPYLPFAAFEEHQDVATGILWKGDPHILLSTSKDGTLFQHCIADASRPGDRANPAAICFSPQGYLSHACRDVHCVNESPITHALSINNAKTLPPDPATCLRVPASFKWSLSMDDLFCATKSHLTMHTVAKKGNEGSAVTDMSWFVHSAKNYRLYGLEFEELCDHNATVAESLGRHQVAHSWHTLKTFYSGSPMKSEHDGPGGAASKTDPDQKMRNRSSSIKDRLGTDDRALDNSAEKHRDHRRKSSVPNGRHASGSSSAKGCGSVQNGRSQTSGESSEDDDLSDTNELTLTNIASGQMLAGFGGDFFGDGELSSLTIEQSLTIDSSYASLLNQQAIKHRSSPHCNNSQGSWELPSEAFDVRHEIREISGHAQSEEFVQNQAQNGSGTAESTVMVTVEDQTSSLLCLDDAQEWMPWSPVGIVLDTLKYFAEKGDIQSTVSMYIVLGEGRLEKKIDSVQVEEWFLAYIDILQQFQLLNIASEIMNLCPVANVQELNHQSTSFCSNCTLCSKALSRHQCAWWCDRCKKTVNNCAICHRAVKGLFTWCQGCGHGGHIEHIAQWLHTHQHCPAGCGHRCEYL